MIKNYKANYMPPAVYSKTASGKHYMEFQVEMEADSPEDFLRALEELMDRIELFHDNIAYEIETKGGKWDDM